MMKTTKAIGIAVTACCAWAACFATSHTVTNNWEQMSSTKYKDGTSDLSATNHWNSDAGNAKVEGGIICVSDEKVNGALKYEPLAPSAVSSIQTVEIHVGTTTLCSADPDSPTAAQGAIVAVGKAGFTPEWRGWCKTGWVSLTGATPTSEKSCDLRIEFDNRIAEARKVRYWVKPENDAWTVLTAADAPEGWMDSDATGDRITGLDFKGAFGFDKISLTQAGTLEIDDKRMKDAGIAAADLNKKAENGNPNWENLVLGLKCDDANSKPVVRPVQTGDSTTVTLALDGVSIDSEANATVKYTVTASDEIGGAGTTTGPYDYAQMAAVDLPGSGVKYYRMNVVTTPK